MGKKKTAEEEWKEKNRIKPPCCFPNEQGGSQEGQLPRVIPQKEKRNDALSPQKHMKLLSHKHLKDANATTTECRPHAASYFSTESVVPCRTLKGEPLMGPIRS